MAEQRLTDQGITLADILKWSRAYYKSKGGDNKAYRCKLDIHSARLTQRKNYEYNAETKQWEQTGRDALFVFLVKSKPISYQKIDEVDTHWYPCYFLIHDINKKMRSTVRWRTGSLKKPIFAQKGSSKDQRVKIANKNVKNQVQMQFFFESEYLLQQKKLLWGRSWANRPPKIANPKNRIFFDKHAYGCVTQILMKLFNNERFIALINKTYPIK